jgi:hypothetical protein
MAPAGSNRADGLNYRTLLRFIHWRLLPRTYVEIGVAGGLTLALAAPGTRVIGVDPAPRLTPQASSKSATVCRETSDEFFQRDNLDELLGHQPVDLAFIDGMHLFEFALRDLMHLERRAAPDGTILVHDCYPIDAATSGRERASSRWTGDVWKVILCLRAYRPDLTVTTLGAAPSGLGVIQGLDPTSQVLERVYDDAVARYRDLPYAALAEGPGKAANLNYRSVTPAQLRRLWPRQGARRRTVELRVARFRDETPHRAKWLLKRTLVRRPPWNPAEDCFGT